MTNEKIYGIAQQWFQQAGMTRIILPDGPFGKPTDVYQVTFLRQRPHKMLLELNGQFLLIFTDVTKARVEYANTAKARVEESELIFSDFAQLLFDWQEGADPPPTRKSISTARSSSLLAWKPLRANKADTCAA